MKKLSLYIGIVTGMIALIGGVFVFDATYTRAARTNQVERRLDRKIAEDNARYLRQRMWDLENRYTVEKAKILPEYKRLEDEREKILRGLK